MLKQNKIVNGREAITSMINLAPAYSSYSAVDNTHKTYQLSKIIYLFIELDTHYDKSTFIYCGTLLLNSLTCL